MKKNKIIIHCTDTPSSMNVTREMLHQWHVIENKWKAIGYAYLIDRTGAIIKCRDLDGDGDVEDEIGAHVAGYNRDSIGIALAGRSEFTTEQWDSLRWLITDISSRHGIKREDIGGHCDYDSRKTCPNFNVQEKLIEWEQ